VKFTVKRKKILKLRYLPFKAVPCRFKSPHFALQIQKTKKKLKLRYVLNLHI
jgi:hypothetical protein